MPQDRERHARWPPAPRARFRGCKPPRGESPFQGESGSDIPVPGHCVAASIRIDRAPTRDLDVLPEPPAIQRFRRVDAESAPLRCQCVPLDSRRSNRLKHQQQQRFGQHSRSLPFAVALGGEGRADVGPERLPVVGIADEVKVGRRGRGCRIRAFRQARARQRNRVDVGISLNGKSLRPPSTFNVRPNAGFRSCRR